jgi:hypothetical protein
VVFSVSVVLGSWACRHSVDIREKPKRLADVTAENDERGDMMVRNDTTIDGVMQMLQTMTPPYVRYLPISVLRAIR